MLAGQMTQIKTDKLETLIFLSMLSTNSLIELPQIIEVAKVIFPNSLWKNQPHGGALRSKILKIIRPEHEHNIELAPFHNKNNPSLTALYYRFEQEKATIAAIGNGTKALQTFLTTFFESFQSQLSLEQFLAFDYRATLAPIGYLEQPTAYRIYNWLPLSNRKDVNFKKEYDNCTTPKAKKELLQNLLKDQVLALLRHLDYDAVYTLSPQITGLTKPTKTIIKKGDTDLSFMMIEAVEFNLNFQLPPQVAFGEHTSIGFGECRACV
jgi:Cas6b C-terminal domain